MKPKLQWPPPEATPMPGPERATRPYNPTRERIEHIVVTAVLTVVACLVLAVGLWIGDFFIPVWPR